MPPKKATPEGFTEQRRADATYYSCDACAFIKGRCSWYKKLTFAVKHVVTHEHMKNVALMNSYIAADRLKKSKLAEELAYESTAVHTLKGGELPSVTVAPSRPTMQGEVLYPMDIDDYRDHFADIQDVVFSAGQQYLAGPKSSSRPFRVPMPVESFGDAADDVDVAANLIGDLLDVAAGNGDIHENGDILAETAPLPLESDYYPYRNRTEFLLDLMDSLPRLQFSDAQLNLIMFGMTELGVPNIPSLKTFRRMQTRLRAHIAVPTDMHRSSRGNVFYVNNLCAQVAKHFSNPLLRPFLHLYPELTHGVVNETWQAAKWAEELGPKQLTPMAIGTSNRHFYVDELARTRDERYVIPLKWFTIKDVLHCSCYNVAHSHDTFSVDRSMTVVIALADLQYSYPNILLKLQADVLHFQECDIDYQLRMPNQWRIRAKGRPVYCVQLRLWQDDVSGNVSKQWNKHWLFCMTLAGLPRRLLAQEYFTNFICCSPDATVLEQAAAIIDSVKHSCVAGVVAMDSETDAECMLFLNILLDSADNPMVCECSSHLGLNANKFCPHCHVGGDKKFKSSDDGYKTLFNSDGGGKGMRTAAATAKEAASQLIKGRQGHDISGTQTLTGVKDAKVTFWLSDKGRTAVASITETDAANFINPFLTLDGFDPHSDCPVEPLHTVLLGIVKYAWHMTHTKVQKQGGLGTLETRLQSINIDGMNIDPIRASYLIQYRNSLIGRQFKTLIQTMSFVLYGLVDDAFSNMWVSAGHMVALMWYPEIVNITEYCDTLRQAIDIFLDCIATVDPTKISVKAKCHILTHLPEDVRRFGPTMGLTTETYEGFNGVFRMCSVLSNRRAPSRDIGHRMSDLGRFKHIASGGKWLEGGEWCTASDKVTSLFRSHDTMHRLLGWTDPTIHKKHTVQRKSKADRVSCSWKDTLGANAIPRYYEYPEQNTSLSYEACVSCVCKSLDKAKPDSFVVLNDSSDNRSIGRLMQLLQENENDTMTGRYYAIIQEFKVGAQHSRLKMPTLHSVGEPVYVLGHVSNIELVFNVQHDCERLHCQATGLRKRYQERIETDLTIPIMVHNPGDHYIVNMHNLHHPHIIRTVFESYLYTIRPTEDRTDLHVKLATRARQLKSSTIHEDDANGTSIATGSKRDGTGKKKGSTSARSTNQNGDTLPYETVWTMEEWLSMPGEGSSN